MKLRNPNAQSITGLMYFHTLFASLSQLTKSQQPSAVLAWVKHFGIPRKSLYEWAIAKAKALNMSYARIPVRNIISDSRLIAYILELVIRLKKHQEEPQSVAAKNALIEWVSNNSQYQSPLIAFDSFSRIVISTIKMGIDKDAYQQLIDAYRSHALEFATNAPSQYAFKTLETIVDCASFRPAFFVNPANDNPVFSWVFDDALTAMWTMVMLDITSSRYIRRCASAKCGCFFVATRPSGKYCSILCQNRTEQGKTRAKKAILTP